MRLRPSGDLLEKIGRLCQQHPLALEAALSGVVRAAAHGSNQLVGVARPPLIGEWCDQVLGQVQRGCDLPGKGNVLFNQLLLVVREEQERIEQNDKWPKRKAAALDPLIILTFVDDAEVAVSVASPLMW